MNNVGKGFNSVVMKEKLIKWFLEEVVVVVVIVEKWKYGKKIIDLKFFKLLSSSVLMKDKKCIIMWLFWYLIVFFRIFYEYLVWVLFFVELKNCRNFYLFIVWS